MLYAWMGFLKPGADQIPPTVQQRTSDFLAQPFINIHSVGPLRDSEGKRVGAMLIFEADDPQKAEAFVKESPYLQAGLYDEYRLYEYENEVG